VGIVIPEAAVGGLSVSLGLVFLSSSVPKLRNPRGFVLTVLDYELMAPSLGQFYGRVLPPAELLLALLLLAGTYVHPAALLVSALSASFAAGVAINMRRGRHVDCGCFGKGGSRRIGWGALLQDIGLLAASVLLFSLTADRVGSESWSVFRLGNVAAIGGLAQLLVCLGAAGGFAAVLGRSRRPGGRWRHIVTGKALTVRE
jgi:hypothetical protein